MSPPVEEPMAWSEVLEAVDRTADLVPLLPRLVDELQQRVRGSESHVIDPHTAYVIGDLHRVVSLAHDELLRLAERLGYVAG